ncbi:MFS general substrate transporter [Artomyces pyxidatus]|uniref:MFS general substrate transporter n=1 Tax=Artomyces pyxidatus TaxID=48021 RepID=A0ACB8T2M8_9AGAM|nr:MFS general substrate transporter [Artomyces pyxidatus]
MSEKMEIASSPNIPKTTPHFEEKRKAGASWKDGEQLVIPKNRMGLVFGGLMGCAFLASLDQTIVATALPTIVESLGGGKNYSWVGSAYLLSSTAVGPLCGKLSDLIGRKPLLYFTILLFLIGSALCGAAQSMTWLIVCRAVQGIGGGGMMQLVQITIADIVSLEDRGKYGGFLGASWGVASVLGPLIGGLISDHASWRWCFYVNLPTGGAAGTILFVFLNLNPHQGMSFREHMRQFDFLGLALIISGVVCVLLGFNSGETSWSTTETIVLLVVGGVLMVAATVNEIYTHRSPIIPPRLFKTRTTSIILIGAFIHSVMLFGGAYYLPLYFQVIGSSATGAGILTIPYTIGSALIAIVAGALVSRYSSYRPVIWIGWSIMLLGMGLMTTLDDRSNTAEKVLYPLVLAIGQGCLTLTPQVALQAAMPIKDMATSTATYGFLRMLGATVGVSIGQAIYSSVLRKKVALIPNVNFDTSPAALSQSVRQLKDIADPVVRQQVIHAYTRAISTIWVVDAPLIGFGLISVLFMKAYTLKQNTVRAGDAEAAAAPTQLEERHDNEITEQIRAVNDDEDADI